jgi:polyphosphate glucokinase
MPKRLTLSIDVGSSHVKAQTVGIHGGAVTERLKLDTPDPLSPAKLVGLLVHVAKQLAPFDRVAIGLPGIVRHGVVYSLPVLGDRRLHRYRLADALRRRLRRPVRIVNDAEMHALGAVKRRGVELVLTLGTGLGSALYLDGTPGPRFEIMTTPGRREPVGGAYGDAARKKIGDVRWTRRVLTLVKTLRRVTNFDDCYIGGGNANNIRGRLPRGVKRIANDAAALGGVRLWEWDIDT